VGVNREFPELVGLPPSPVPVPPPQGGIVYACAATPSLHTLPLRGGRGGGDKPPCWTFLLKVVLLQLVPTLFFVSGQIIFFAAAVIARRSPLRHGGESVDPPRDPHDIREQYRLDHPVPIQYVLLDQGSLSMAILVEIHAHTVPVRDLFHDKLPVTMHSPPHGADIRVLRSA